MTGLFAREPREVAPGAVHTPDWLDPAEQREVVRRCREWAPRMRSTVLPGGGRMSVRTVCLGWHWSPYRYDRVTEDGSPVPELPEWLADLGTRAVGRRDYRPDVALVNFYGPEARMGQHRDREERCAEPVVSLSLGDTAVFRFGNTTDLGRPWTDLHLCSGDLFVFGGESRFAYHGVPRTLPGTADPALDLRGRLNITLRVSGLD